MARNAGTSGPSGGPGGPGRRPLNRNREKANAAQRREEHRQRRETRTMRIVLKNQRGNVRRRERVREVVEADAGRDQQVELSVPSGLSAAETTNRIGNRAKNESDQEPTRCRQPTCAEPAALRAAETDDVRAARRAGVPGGRVDDRCRSSVDLLQSVRPPEADVDTVATIRKMRIDMAAAKPYCAPASPKARR